MLPTDDSMRCRCGRENPVGVTFTVNFFRPFFRRVHNLPKDAQFSPFRYDKKITRQKSEKSYEIAIFITTQVVYTFEAIEACY